jgi:hypothetical protein
MRVLVASSLVTSRPAREGVTLTPDESHYRSDVGKPADFYAPGMMAGAMASG